MTKDKGGDPSSQPAHKRAAPDRSIVTPEEEPSALERGARIFERLADKRGRDSG